MQFGHGSEVWTSNPMMMGTDAARVPRVDEQGGTTRSINQTAEMMDERGLSFDEWLSPPASSLSLSPPSLPLNPPLEAATAAPPSTYLSLTFDSLAYLPPPALHSPYSPLQTLPPTPSLDTLSPSELWSPTPPTDVEDAVLSPAAFGVFKDDDEDVFFHQEDTYYDPSAPTLYSNPPGYQLDAVSLRADAVVCDVCDGVVGIGGVTAKKNKDKTSAVPAPSFTVETLCKSCVDTYRACTDCGGGGGRLTPEMLERGDGLVGNWRECVGSAVDLWALVKEGLEQDVEEETGIRRYVGTQTSAPHKRRATAAKSSAAGPDDVSDENSVLAGFALVEHDLKRGSVFFAAMVPWATSGHAFDATTLLSSTLLERISSDLVTLNSTRRKQHLPPYPPVKNTWLLSPFREDSKLTHSIRRRGFAGIEEWFERYPEEDRSAFLPERECWLPKEYTKGWKVFVKKVEETTVDGDSKVKSKVKSGRRRK
ncbi:hypothetical protein MNV49_006533 [Pseudohyphozyma bogoriensis]|nr:hypothetical protein MNV49_006533 [Pseudohyphozyma bogoriensis]